jgi:hypothetical protein
MVLSAGRETEKPEDERIGDLSKLVGDKACNASAVPSRSYRISIRDAVCSMRVGTVYANFRLSIEESCE